MRRAPVFKRAVRHMVCAMEVAVAMQVVLSCLEA